MPSPHSFDFISNLASSLGGKSLSCHQLPRTGSKNAVYKVVDLSGQAYALCLGKRGAENDYINGIHIASQLMKEGLPFPATLAFDVEGKFSQYPSALMEIIAGRDLEHVLDTLSEQQAQTIAMQAAHAVQVSTKVFSGGLGIADPRFGCKLHEIDYHESVNWYANRVFDRFDLKFDWPHSSAHRERFLCAFEELPRIAPEMFIWDMAERNIMIDGGQLTGFVDQDSLLTGDRLDTAAMSSAFLAGLGVQHAEAYTRAWLKEWGALGDSGAVGRFLVYRALHVVNSIAPSRSEEATFANRIPLPPSDEQRIFAAFAKIKCGVMH